MKKSLLALSMLAAVSCYANAADVTLYGKMDASLRFTSVDADIKNQETLNTFEMATGNHSANRFGLIGTEDLGNGLQVTFLLENGFEADSGALSQDGSIFGRQASLSLKGNFGEVTAGRMAVLSYTAGTHGLAGAFSPFGTGWGDVGNQNLVFGGADFAPLRNNVITYSTPLFAGFKVHVQYAMGDTSENKSTADRYYAVAASYKAGALDSLVILENLNRASADNPDAEDAKRVLAGGSYDLGMVKPFVSASYFKDSKLYDMLGTWNQDSQIFAGHQMGDHAANLDRLYDGFGLTVGASMPFAGGTAHGMVGYMDAEYSAEGNGTINATRSIDVQRLIAGVGYEYPLSKRTLIYTDAGYFKDDIKCDSRKYNFAPSGYQAALGIVHSF